MASLVHCPLTGDSIPILSVIFISAIIAIIISCTRRVVRLSREALLIFLTGDVSPYSHFFLLAILIFAVRIIIIIVITMITGQVLNEGRILLDVVPFSKELLELTQVVCIDADIMQEILI